MALAISQVTFPLPNISKLDRIRSFEVTLHDVPWQVELIKADERLSILFRCAKKDNSSQWSFAAQTSVKLFSLDPNKNPFGKQFDPQIFCSSAPNLFCYLIDYDTLLEAENNYVKDDAIKLEVNIQVADPNDEKRSIVLFEPLDKCCDGSATAEFRLTVMNIDALMAVQAPVFMMRNNPWILTVCKSRSDHLRLRLSTEWTSGDVRATFKLISTKPNVESKRGILIAHPLTGKYVVVCHLASWENLFDPHNGYVNKDSVVIEVNIKMDKPQGTANVGTKRRAVSPLEADANLIRLKCAICLENINKDDTSSTVCGHVFCTRCIKGVIETRKLCPLCNTKLDLNKLFRIFLPIKK